MTALRFYHLTERPLEAVAPALLETCLKHGMRAAVRAGSDAALRGLDQALWTYSDAAFLPHGLASEPHAGKQPILLGASDPPENGAAYLMLVAGASQPPESLTGFDRVALLFDDQDLAAKDRARADWRAAAAAGLPAEYWAQEGGRWVKKMENAGAPD
ncbi:MAG: DNA polymerase III subunit chi [Pseudomonadota bacterium]